MRMCQNGFICRNCISVFGLKISKYHFTAEKSHKKVQIPFTVNIKYRFIARKYFKYCFTAHKKSPYRFNAIPAHPKLKVSQSIFFYFMFQNFIYQNKNWPVCIKIWAWICFIPLTKLFSILCYILCHFFWNFMLMNWQFYAQSLKIMLILCHATESTH